MSKRGEQLAADYVTAILGTTGITKAAGAASPALLMAAVSPLAEAIVDRDRQLARHRKHIRRVDKAIKRNQRVLDSIMRPEAATVSPMRLPARPKPQQVDFRPEDWRLSLSPASEPLRNGASHHAEASEPPGQAPPGHPG